MMMFTLQLHKLPKCLERKCGKELFLANEAAETWTSHQDILSIEMNGVAGDTLENQRRSLLNEATAELQMHQRQSREHLQKNIRSVFGATFQQVASGGEVEMVRHELSQSLAEVSHCQQCLRQTDLVRPKVHQKFSSCDKGRDHLIVEGRNMETETPRHRSAAGPLEAQVAHILRLRGMLDVERQNVDHITGGSCLPWIRKTADLSTFRCVKGRGCPVALQARCNEFWASS